MFPREFKNSDNTRIGTDHSVRAVSGWQGVV